MPDHDLAARWAEKIASTLQSRCYLGLGRSQTVALISPLVAAALAEAEQARRVADSLVVRRDVEREIGSGRMMGLPQNTPYWNDLMRRERDARIENDKALAEYRSPAPEAAATKEDASE